MAKDTEKSHLDQAREFRHEGAFVEAGDRFTVNAYENLGRSTPHVTWWGLGLVNLQRAALCYRIGGRMDRCENRCRQGTLIAEDMIDHVFESDPEYYWDRARRGCWYEHIGDFRVIGRMDDAATAYERAIEIYRTEGDPDTYLAEEEHIPLMELFRFISEAADRDHSPIDERENGMTFTDWVRHKQEELPVLIETLCERQQWT